MTRADLSVQAVSRDQEARGTCVHHFSDPSLIHLDHVTGVVRRMHDRVTRPAQTMTLSYIPDNGTFQALGVGPLPAGASIDDVEAFVVQRGAAAATPLTVCVAPAFFTGTALLAFEYPLPGAGTILLPATG